jgi:hypothetical protein
LGSTSDFPDVETLELINLPKLKSLKGLERFPKLKKIKLHRLHLISDVSTLAYLTDLVEVDCSDCTSLEVEGKPKGQMTRPQTIKYLIKIAEHYKLKNLNEWKSKVEETPVAGPPLPAKTIQKIKKLLLSREIKEIKSGISMALEANNLSLYEDLLQGIDYSEKALKPNKIFTGSGPAQPFLNMAMTGILSAASISSPGWKIFCDKITELKMELPSVDYLNSFQKLKKLELTHVAEFSIDLKLPLLESFQIKRWGWGGIKLTQKFAFSQLEACQELKLIHLENEITADNLKGVGKLKYLQELHMNNITGLKMQDLTELVGCRLLKSLEIRKPYCDNAKQRNKINNLNGIENLENLEELVFESVELQSTNAFSGMKSLKRILLQDNDSLTEFIPPINAEKLETLNLSGCPNLSKIGDSNFGSNLSLNIENTGFTSFPTFKGVIKLENLYFSNCEKMENLIGFEKISFVDDDNRIQLNGCTALKNLDGISQIKDIELRLDTVALPSIKAPNGIKHLKASALKSLEGIAQFSELVKLDISSSNITKLNGLEDLKKLKVLNLSKMIKLKSLKGLEAMSSLEQLILFDLENIDDISAIENLPLRSIYIRGCKKKKADFPLKLQNIIDWQSSYVSNY